MSNDRVNMKIGVLALQGDFAEHIVMLRRLGVETAEVRLPGHLAGLDGLIMPGGESTTIGKLAVAFGLMEPLREFGNLGYLRGRYFPFEGCPARAAAAQPDGYHGRAQCFWRAGRFF